MSAVESTDIVMDKWVGKKYIDNPESYFSEDIFKWLNDRFKCLEYIKSDIDRLPIIRTDYSASFMIEHTFIVWQSSKKNTLMNQNDIDMLCEIINLYSTIEYIYLIGHEFDDNVSFNNMKVPKLTLRKCKNLHDFSNIPVKELIIKSMDIKGFFDNKCINSSLESFVIHNCNFEYIEYGMIISKVKGQFIFIKHE